MCRFGYIRVDKYGMRPNYLLFTDNKTGIGPTKLKLSGERHEKRTKSSM